MQKPAPKTLQDQLFQQIREIVPPGKTVADVVAETLHISQDSAYRRLRGETLLVLEEAKELCHRFGLSLDTLFSLKNNSIIFHRTEIDAAAYDFSAYLKGMLYILHALEKCRDKNIVYLTKGIPLFHVFPYRPLLAFRYYFWMRTTFEVPELRQQKFSFELLPQATAELGMEVLSAYNRIPSVEIWSAECTNSTLLQLEFCRDAGLIKAKQANEVLESLRQMLEHLHAQVEEGRKFLPPENPQSKKENFQLFYNGMGLGNDLILTVHEGQKTVYVNNDALDYLTCTDDSYCEKVQQKLQTILRRSTLISGVGEKQRSMFFNKLYAKLDEASGNEGDEQA